MCYYASVSNVGGGEGGRYPGVIGVAGLGEAGEYPMWGNGKKITTLHNIYH